MSPSGLPGRDDPDGELTAPPPSDLSDYTWDDSDRPSPGPALRGGEGELADGRPLPSRDELFRNLVDGLLAHRLVDQQELRTLCFESLPRRYAPRPRTPRDRTGPARQGDALPARRASPGKDQGPVHRRIRRPREARLRGHGHCLQGATSGDPARRRAEAAAPLIQPRSRRGLPLPPRGRRRRKDAPSEHRPGDRGGRDQWPVFPGHGTGRGQGPFEDREGEGSAAPGPGPRLHHPGGPGIAGGPPARHHPPRHQAGERAPGPVGHGEGARPGTGPRERDPRVLRGRVVRHRSHPERVRRRHRGLHGAEQAYDPRLADHRADIYSLGCTLHYLLTGKAPYGGQTFMQRLLAHRERPIPSLQDARKDVSAKLDAVFRRLVAKSPEGRPQTMGQAIAELESCLPSPPGEKTKRAVPRKRSETDEDDPGSVYEFAVDVQAQEARRSETAGSVFVRSRGSSDDRAIGPSGPRRRRRRWLIRFVILAAAAVAAWFFLRR